MASTLADKRWLFPGKWASQHKNPTSLMGRLNRLGITTRASRNTAMFHLAVTVPPAVFASLIGISIGAATQWAEYAGQNWTIYAAIRSKGVCPSNGVSSGSHLSGLLPWASGRRR